MSRVADRTSRNTGVAADAFPWNAVSSTGAGSAAVSVTAIASLPPSETATPVFANAAAGTTVPASRSKASMSPPPSIPLCTSTTGRAITATVRSSTVSQSLRIFLSATNISSPCAFIIARQPESSSGSAATKASRRSSSTVSPDAKMPYRSRKLRALRAVGAECRRNRNAHRRSSLCGPFDTREWAWSRKEGGGAYTPTHVYNLYMASRYFDRIMNSHRVRIHHRASDRSETRSQWHCQAISTDLR